MAELSLSVSARITAPTADAHIGAAVSQQGTERSPPRIRFTLANSGDGPQRLDAGFTPPFSTYVLERNDGGAELVFVPQGYSGGRYVPPEPREGCWTATGTPIILETGTLTTLDPGEEVANEYVLLNHPENDSCFPAGRYDATDTVRLDKSRTPVEMELAVEVARKRR